MTLRATLAAALLVTGLAAPVPAATAAPAPRYVTYEIVRVKAGGPAWFTLDAMGRTDGPEGLVALLHVGRSGTGYGLKSMQVAQYNGGDGAFRTYGWPAEPVCPARCDGEPARFGFGIREVLRPAPGDRVLVAGIPGHLTITVGTPHWRARRSTSGFRTAGGAGADATGAEWLGGRVEQFRSATAAGGPYGSAAFGILPCFTAGAGTALLTTEVEESFTPALCARGVPPFTYGATRTGRTWTFEGAAAGDYLTTHRLVVFDFPKR